MIETAAVFEVAIEDGDDGTVPDNMTFLTCFGGHVGDLVATQHVVVPRQQQRRLLGLNGGFVGHFATFAVAQDDELMSRVSCSPRQSMSRCQETWAGPQA